MSRTQLRIATRKSQLALWQAEYVADRLRQLHPQLEVVLVPMSSKGDRILDAPLAKVGGKGLFIKELEQALLRDEADLAVHSMKDVPIVDELPPELHVPIICEREDPHDAFVSNHHANFAALPPGARVGTSSLRRQSQLLAARPDLNISFLRGNVNSRLAKLDAGEFDAIILATAGLLRLGFSDRIGERLDSRLCLPAVGQGAVGIECRRDDVQVNALLAPLNHPPTAARVLAERAMNARLRGGCQVPIGGYAELSDGVLFLRGLVGSSDGSTLIRGDISGHVEQAEELGQVLADDLLSRGAAAILAELHATAD